MLIYRPYGTNRSLRFNVRTMSETMTEKNCLNPTAKSGLHFSLHSVNQRAVRLRDM